MNTYLFLWNPKKWNWSSLEQDIERVNFNGRCSQNWSCGNTKSIKPGDRIFLLKTGTEPKGIIAAGFSSSVPFYDIHWSGVKAKNTLFVNVDFEVLLNPDKDQILTVDNLKNGNLDKQNWSPMASGISIKPEIVNELESVWFDFLTTQNIRHNPFVETEIDEQKSYTEGTPNQVLVTKYERNPFARKTCIDFYGVTCSVCKFDFEANYGVLGKGFIHVHHLKQVSHIGKEYKIDPVKDLRPVCPNCHAMLH